VNLESPLETRGIIARAMFDVVVLGCGYAGAAVARLARERHLSVVATVRNPERAARLVADGIEVIAAPQLSAEAIARLISPQSHVVVAFSPDGETDARIAPACAHAAAITYVSSTSVYGSRRGVIDESTPLPEEQTARSAPIVAAETTWRAVGATVLRCPAIYGADRGLHLRIVRGEHRIAGDGSAFTSRIHVEDLAQLILASRATRAETFVVGDLEPATQNEIATWISHEYGVAFPERVPLASVPESLRADRRIDPAHALGKLDVTLRFPSFREGMKKS
jgi:nucleoside-diphosphate-sugar epimerase